MASIFDTTPGPAKVPFPPYEPLGQIHLSASEYQLFLSLVAIYLNRLVASDGLYLVSSDGYHLNSAHL